MSATKGKLTEHQRAVWRTASLRPDDDFSPDTKQCAARRAARRRCRVPCRSNVTVCVGNDITDMRKSQFGSRGRCFLRNGRVEFSGSVPQSQHRGQHVSVEWLGFARPVSSTRSTGRHAPPRGVVFSEWKFHSARWWVPRGQRCDRRCGQGPTAALCVAARFFGNLLN